MLNLDGVDGCDDVFNEVTETEDVTETETETETEEGGVEALPLPPSPRPRPPPAGGGGGGGGGGSTFGGAVSYSSMYDSSSSAAATTTTTATAASSTTTTSRRTLLREQLPATRLRFETLGLVGRRKERQILLECLERCSSHNSNCSNVVGSTNKDVGSKRSNNSATTAKNQLVLVGGHSGTGKTALVLSTLQKEQQKQEQQQQRQQLHASASASAPESSSTLLVVYGKNEMVLSSLNNNSDSNANANGSASSTRRRTQQGEGEEQPPYQCIASALNDACLALLRTLSGINKGRIAEKGGKGEEEEDQQQQQEEEEDRSSFELFDFLCTNLELLRLLVPIIPALGKIIDFGVGATEEENSKSHCCCCSRSSRSSSSMMLEKEEEVQEDKVDNGKTPTTSSTRNLPPDHDDSDDSDNSDDLQEGNSNNNNNSTGEAKTQQINYAFRVLVKIILRSLSLESSKSRTYNHSHSSPSYPCLVVVLDDLQWCDQSSLELIEILLEDDPEINNLMIVGCYRSNEVLMSIPPPPLPPPPPRSSSNSNKDSDDDVEDDGTCSSRHPHRLVRMVSNLTNNRVDIGTTGSSTTATRMLAADDATTNINNNYYDSMNNMCSVSAIGLDNLTLHETDQVIQGLLYGTMSTTTEMEDDGDGDDEDVDPKKASAATSKTIGLAVICHRRTLGNVFFLLQFMKMLQERDLIQFNLGKWDWTWNLQDVEDKTAATENVVDVVREGMINMVTQKEASSSSNHRRSSSYGQFLSFLKVASCLGSSFSKRALELSWTDFRVSTRQKKSDDVPQKDDSGDDVSMHIETAVNGKYIERLGTRIDSSKNAQNLRWAHDKIHEAAISLIRNDEEAKRIKFSIGTTLLLNLSRKDLHDEIFCVANLFNDSNSEDVDSISTSVCDVNTIAAEKAKSLSAFATSLKYTIRGIALLPPDPWTQENRDRTIQLYTIGVESAGCTARTKTMNDMSDIVLNRNDLTALEKVPVYCSIVGHWTNAGRVEDGIQLSLTVIQELGLKIPRRSFMQTINAASAALALKRHPPTRDDVNSLPEMTSKEHLACMKLLLNMTSLSYLAGKYTLAVIANTTLINFTMKYGSNDFGACGFAVMAGFIAVLFGDYQLADTLVGHAHTILDSRKSKLVASKVYFSCIAGTEFTRPLQNSIKLMEDGYQLGLRYGDIESAMWNVGHRIWIWFFTGKSLQMIDADCRVYVPQMLKLEKIEGAHFAMCCWQAVINLMKPIGVTKLTIMAGEAFGGTKNEEETLRLGEGYKVLRLHSLVGKLALCAHYGEYEEGSNLALEHGDDFRKAFPTQPQIFWEAFYKAACLYGMAGKMTCLTTNRRRKSRKSSYYYARHAEKYRNLIQKWVQRGNPNCFHHAALLDAEHNGLHYIRRLQTRENKGKSSSSASASSRLFDGASRSFQKAIVAASRGGFLSDAALANDRYLCYLLLVLKCRCDTGAVAETAMQEQQYLRDEITYRLDETVRLYREWGADGKVQSLQLVMLRDPRTIPGF